MLTPSYDLRVALEEALVVQEDDQTKLSDRMFAATKVGREIHYVKDGTHKRTRISSISGNAGAGRI